ncbi:hypothetical protein CMI37_14820 [Candidatus Pacearchaeota archaeon]|nr:hypothetical protein [Candidatus Pacearchaeota archaeon]|tara:strand:+ start:960 stop:1790 length:831 start_codon:yes stop_codon:yes gene_type:complete
MKSPASKKFFIFTDTRTGSSCLFNILAKAYFLEFRRDVILRGIAEPFHPRVISYFYKKEIYNALYPVEPNFEENPRKWTDEGRLLKEEWPVVNNVFNKSFEMSHGIKHIWNHLCPEQNYLLLEKALSRGYKIIFLYREGVVKKCLSHTLSEQSKEWRWHKKKPEFKNINLERLNRLVERYTKSKEEYEAFLSGHEYYPVSYEGFLGLDSYRQKIERVFDILEFCEIKIENTPISLCKKIIGKNRKMTTKEILRLIPNLKEVCEFAKNKYNEDIMSS